MKQQSVFGREFISCQRDNSVDHRTWLLVFLSFPMYPLSAILNTNTRTVVEENVIMLSCGFLRLSCYSFSYIVECLAYLQPTSDIKHAVSLRIVPA